MFLDAAPIKIGDNCMTGPKTCIYAVTHLLDAKAPIKYLTQTSKKHKIKIQTNYYTSIVPIILRIC